MYYSLPRIDFSSAALKNSAENLCILQDKYGKGLVNITDVLNAEDDHFEKELEATVAVYDFLIDLTTLNRQLTNFFLIMSEDEKNEWQNTMRSFFVRMELDRLAREGNALEG